MCVGWLWYRASRRWDAGSRLAKTDRAIPRITGLGSGLGRAWQRDAANCLSAPKAVTGTCYEGHTYRGKFRQTPRRHLVLSVVSARTASTTRYRPATQAEFVPHAPNLHPCERRCARPGSAVRPAAQSKLRLLVSKASIASWREYSHISQCCSRFPAPSCTYIVTICLLAARSSARLWLRTPTPPFLAVMSCRRRLAINILTMTPIASTRSVLGLYSPVRCRSARVVLYAGGSKVL